MDLKIAAVVNFIAKTVSYYSSGSFSADGRMCRHWAEIFLYFLFKIKTFETEPSLLIPAGA